MSLADRAALYKSIEAKRKHPLIVYVTSSRQGAPGVIARDAIPELLAQLQALPKRTQALDLLLVSNGGDGTVAWRIVSLIRERVSKFSVLIPQAAFSAATLISLGADEIIMHPHGNLGPTDPQITNRQKGTEFGSEDLAAFLKFARDEVGLTDQAPLLEVFKLFSQEVGVASIGVAARGSQLAVTMGEKLLRLHMVSESDGQKARVISESLNSKYFHHGYPLSRKEAQEIGLRIVDGDEELEELMWAAWLDLEKEMQLREPFSPVDVLKKNLACAALFGPVPQLQIPQGIPPQAAQQILQQFLQQHGLMMVPPAPFELIHSVMESARHATRFLTTGSIYGSRQPDLQIKVTVVNERSAWVDVSATSINLTAGAVATSSPSAPSSPVASAGPATLPPAVQPPLQAAASTADLAGTATATAPNKPSSTPALLPTPHAVAQASANQAGEKDSQKKKTSLSNAEGSPDSQPNKAGHRTKTKHITKRAK